MKICPHCQHQNQAPAKFCNNCGAKLESAKRAAERRQLTMLFCDLVDSTALSERLDPEEYRQIITNYHQVAEEVFNQHKGHVAQYMGDGLLVYFGYPVGLEDAPRVAVRAGLGVLKELEQANKEWMAAGNPEVKVRIGVHTGLAVVDEHLALGESVNIAARLEGLAPHNGLVISPDTNHLISGWFEVKSIGAHSLKGISEPLEVFQVLKETEAASPLDIAKRKGLTPLVGRDGELQRIKDYWKQAKNGQGNLVLINGEPGIGKSRIIDTVLDQVGSETGSRVLLARSSMYRQYSAFYPLIEVLERQVFHFEVNMTPDEKLSSLADSLNRMGLDSNTYLPLLTELLSIASEQFPPPAMSPFAKRAKTIDSLSALLLKYAGNNPLLLVIEDLHWSDASTMEWLGTFLKQLGTAKLLILSSSRPEYDSSSLDHNFQQIDLDRLSVEDTVSICRHQTRGKTLPEEILGEIALKTGGIPLFVEELTKTIIESDLLVEQADRYQVVKPVSSISIPTTLQDSLLARLDRLDEVKEIVQVGSVIGREFSLEILNEVMPEKVAELEPSIQKLMEVDILRHQMEEDQSVYQFKHALIQDTAYESLLRSDRKRIHRNVAMTLENKFAHTAGQQPEVLAHHYTEAGELVKAVPLWLQAGQKASKNNATAEATGHLEKGISLVSKLEDDSEYKEWELDLLLTLGGTYVVSLGFPHPKVKQTFDQAREIAQAMGASPKLALILFNLLSYYFNTEDYRSADELSTHMLEIARDSEHGYWFELFACHLVSGGQLLKGDFLTAIDAFDKELEMFRPELPFPWELTPSGYAEICAKAWLMLAKYAVGDFDQAKNLCDNHLAYAKDHKDSMTLYHIYTFPALYKLEAREWSEAEKFIELYFPIVREFGDPVFILTAEVYGDIARAFQGDDQAFEKAVQSLKFCFQIGFKAFAATVSSYVADYFIESERYEEGLSFINNILIHVNETGTHIHTAELTRIKGLALKGLGNQPDTVEEHFKQAIEIAKGQSARTFELRASCDLARLWEGQGKSDQAYELLHNVYGSLPDGSDSIDMKEASNLLQRLSLSSSGI